MVLHLTRSRLFPLSFFNRNTHIGQDVLVSTSATELALVFHFCSAQPNSVLFHGFVVSRESRLANVCYVTMQNTVGLAGS